jgi:putative transposase
MQNELASRSAGVSGDDRDLDAELVGRASVALADALDLILDDFSCFIIAWKLCTTMKAEDVTETLELALKASGCESAKVAQRPRLLSDNGSSYIAGDLAEWLGDRGIRHIRGAPFHLQTQDKIERWHQTLKNRILLENYYLAGDLEA